MEESPSASRRYKNPSLGATPTTRVDMLLPTTLVDKIDALAKEAHTSRLTYIREIIEVFVDERKKPYRRPDHEYLERHGYEIDEA